MQTREKFEAAIVANPEDDALRLIYADWLDENGDSLRAELIRTQYQEVNAIREGADPTDLIARSDRLIAEHRENWVSPICGRGVREVTFFRGFVDEVQSTAAAFIRHGRTWVVSHPFRGLVLHRAAGRATQLAACPHLARITSLSIIDLRFSDDDLAALLQSPHLRRLTSLALERRWTFVPIPARENDPTLITPDSDEGVERIRLVRPRRMGRVTDQGVIAMLRSPNLPSLTHACIVFHQVTDEALRALATAPFAPQLKSLSLDQTLVRNIDPDLIAAIFRGHPDLTVSMVWCPIPTDVQRELLRRFSHRIELSVDLADKLEQYYERVAMLRDQNTHTVG
jgi:uncharacterized protein (TIGR02996 family)